MIISQPNAPENEALRAFATSVLGDKSVFADVSRQAGRRSIVWRVAVKSGEHYYLKRHEAQRLYAREIHALQEWLPLLPEPTWWSTAALIAKSDELGAAILTEVKGGIVDSTPVTPDERLEMFKLAGRFANLLHSLPYEDESGEDYAEYFVGRFETYMDMAKPYLNADTIRWARNVVGAGEAFAGVKRVVVHCDYSPRNWLIDRRQEGIRFGLIDWERTRPEHWLQDAQRMAQDHWARQPELRQAFFEGYGRQPTVWEERQLNLLVLTNAIPSIPWAIDHHDDRFVALSRAAIERLRRVL